MTNPYENVNWPSIKRIGSASHMHISHQKDLENGIRHGILHFPISNYYPSAPYSADTRTSDFWLKQHWPAIRTDGSTLEPPINWNEVITWAEELDEPFRSNIPVSPGDRVFKEIPVDVMISPNAEHHGFTNSASHICCPGSSFISGNIDPQGNKYRLKAHGFSVGFGRTWEEGFEGMLANLKYPEGGGITINHPTWFSKLSDENVFEMLDFDDRVLGIEIYNNYSGQKNWFENPDYFKPDESEVGFSLNLWDRILSTGRRCWGFCVPDHSVQTPGDWIGRNILLVSEATEFNCLGAYRQGNFYGCLKDNGLTITDFTVKDSLLSITLNADARITFISESGVLECLDGTSASFQAPSDSVFVRIEIEDQTGERLFLQPILFHRQ